MSQVIADRLEKLQSEYDAASKVHDRAQAALDVSMETLQKEFGVETIEEAEKKLASLEKYIESRSTRILKKLDELEQIIADSAKQVYGVDNAESIESNSRNSAQGRSRVQSGRRS